MYTPYLVLALSVASVTNQFKSNPHRDSANHYNAAVGYYQGNERLAVATDSTKLVTLTPSESVVTRNAMSKTQKWFLTENYAEIIKKPIPKYKSTFLNPVNQ